jgi:hypothetical protein
LQNKNLPKHIEIVSINLLVDQLKIVLDFFFNYFNFSFRDITVENISSPEHFDLIKKLSNITKLAEIKFSSEISNETKVSESNKQSVTEELYVDGIKYYCNLVEVLNIFKNIKILYLNNLPKDLEVTN